MIHKLFNKTSGCVPVFLILIFCSISFADPSVSPFSSLEKKLIQDGFGKKYINTLYSDPSIQLTIKTIALFSTHREANLNYNIFLSKRRISRADEYMKGHLKDLERAEKNFGVAKEIITAIILVETRLGTYTGRSSILNTLSSIAALSNGKVRIAVFNQISRSEKRDPRDFNAWSDRKSQWAYKELKAFLQYTKKSNIDPMSISGSYAGAFGIPQFMPTNIIAHARDGNKDGKIDLFNHSDAIASIAGFLKDHGWRKGLNRWQKYRVLLNYNYSKPYANTLLTIAGLLKGMQ